MLLVVFVLGFAGSMLGQEADSSMVLAEADRFLQNCDSAHSAGKYREGLLLADSVLNLLKKANLNQGPRFLKALNSKCTFLYEQGIYPEAEAVGLSAKSLAENLFGRSHQEYAGCLNNLGIVYYHQSRYERVDTLWVEAKNIYGNTLGKTSVEYANLLNNLSSLDRVLGRFAASEAYLQEAKVVRLKLFGENSSQYADILNNLGILYYYMGRLNEVEAQWLKTKEIRKKTLGTEHPDFANILNNLAFYYNQTGQYKKSESIYKETILVREQTLGKEHPDYASGLNNLANLYTEMGRLSEAEPLYLQAKAIRERNLGKMHEDYASSQLNLGNLYKATARYPEAEKALLEAMEIRKKIFGDSHGEYAGAAQSLGNLYKDIGKYEKAENLYLETIKIRKKTSGKLHHEYAAALYNLALLYDEMGRFSESEPLFITAISIFENALGKEHPKYATCLNGLAGLYLSMGRYAAAESNYLEAKNIREKTPGKNHCHYGESLNNLALLYKILGKIKESEAYYKEAISVWEETLGKHHPNYASALNGLATVYNSAGRYKEAEALYYQVKSIRKKTIGKKHPNYAMLLNNLATLYATQKRFKKAEPLLLKAKSILEQSANNKSPDYGIVLNNLAALNEDVHCYQRAESFYRQSLALRAEILGKNHTDYARAAFNLADFYYKIAQPSADSILNIAAPIQRTIITAAARHLSEKELADYTNTFQNDLDNQLSYAFTRPYASGILPTIAYDNILFYKGFLLQAAAAVKNQALADTASAKIWQNLASLRRRLANQYSKPIAERDSANVAGMEEKANVLEKDLARLVAGFGAAFKPAGWQDVQARLNPDEAVVEFVQFKKTFPKTTDSTLYAALLLRPGWEQPRFVPLFEERVWLESFSCEGIKNEGECASFRYHSSAANPEPSELCRLVYQPLESHLNGVKTIFFSPAGQLHLLNFGAMGIGGDSILSQKYRLVQLGSSRQLLNRDEVPSEKTQATAILFGGVQYDMDSVAITAANSRLETSSLYKKRSSGLDFHLADSTLQAIPFEYLQGTAEEVENIGPIIQNRGIAVHTFSGYAATEEAFKHMGQSAPPPRILHLATHGFFYPNPKDSGVPSRWKTDEPIFKISDHPMIRSGLLLAGANQAWQSGKTANPDLEDGILTAYEISQTNLQGTELVVLSACQTGLGDLQANEGVYGLQRAFKIAGVRYLVMSLWEVPDGETQEFMTLFYQKWLAENLSLPHAFQAAQASMRTKYPGQPLNWAGWVLVE